MYSIAFLRMADLLSCRWAGMAQPKCQAKPPPPPCPPHPHHPQAPTLASVPTTRSLSSTILSLMEER